MTVYFYSPREEPYGCFSNFSRHGIEIDSVWWPTVEHFFQAQKFVGTPYAERIQHAATPKQAAELGELPEEDAAEYLGALGLPALGADRVVQAGYRALNLISFLTAGEDEVRAWTVTRGAKAPAAAGKIHTDFERGFIRAEVVHYDDLMAYEGSMKAAREHGKVRLEGKEYVVRDGDVIEFRFNVSK